MSVSPRPVQCLHHHRSRHRHQCLQLRQYQHHRLSQHHPHNPPHLAFQVPLATPALCHHPPFQALQVIRHRQPQLCPLHLPQVCPRLARCRHPRQCQRHQAFQPPPATPVLCRHRPVQRLQVIRHQPPHLPQVSPRPVQCLHHHRSRHRHQCLQLRQYQHHRLSQHHPHNPPHLAFQVPLATPALCHHPPFQALQVIRHRQPQLCPLHLPQVCPRLARCRHPRQCQRHQAFQPPPATPVLCRHRPVQRLQVIRHQPPHLPQVCPRPARSQHLRQCLHHPHCPHHRRCRHHRHNRPHLAFPLPLGNCKHLH
ncbi:uncharacterized protein [Montipora foliosa]|uniref:uncharacterized protein n=1 Tax=Montipora foliosa TaxID=591990 RepID=UPI0035F19D84